RPVRAEFRAGVGAADLDAEREAADGLRRTGIETSGLRLASLPAFDGLLGNAGAEIPCCRPQSRGDDQERRQDGRPKAARTMADLDHGAVKRANTAFQRSTIVCRPSALSSPVAADDPA